MQKEHQPQTTNNGNDRDAAIQIPAAKTKLRCLFDGAHALNRCGDDDNSYGGLSRQLIAADGAAMELAGIIDRDKRCREAGKKRVRELVKLGREAAE